MTRGELGRPALQLISTETTRRDEGTSFQFDTLFSTLEDAATSPDKTVPSKTEPLCCNEEAR